MDIDQTNPIIAIGTNGIELWKLIHFYKINSTLNNRVSILNNRVIITEYVVEDSTSINSVIQYANSVI